MKNIIFIAPPSAGKGTQSAILVEKYGYTHISTGDLFRKAAKADTPLGHDINLKLEAGEFISDEITNELLKNTLDNTNNKIILDGYPRTLEQAEFLDQIIDDNYIVIYLDIKMEEALQRVLGRATCEECSAIYNIHLAEMMPKVEGECDHCPGSLKIRSDDNEESFKNRFDTFERNTLPLMDYYKAKAKLVMVRVMGTPEETFTNIEKVIG